MVLQSTWPMVLPCHLFSYMISFFLRALSILCWGLRDGFHTVLSIANSHGTALANGPWTFQIHLIKNQTSALLSFQNCSSSHVFFSLTQNSQLPNPETSENIFSNDFSIGFLPLNLDFYHMYNYRVLR